jgi:hypothetical protein
MVGHPILILGIGLLGYLRQWPKSDSSDEAASAKPTPPLAGWAALAMMIGSMGQTDIVNTLCHLHIPVMLSVIRILLGALLGCIIGLALWTIVLRLLPKAEA